MKQLFQLFLIALCALLITTPHNTKSEITTIIVSFNTLYRPDAKKIEHYIRSKLNLRNYLSLIIKGIPASKEITDHFFSLLNQVDTINNLTYPIAWQTNYSSYETNGHKLAPIFCQMLNSNTLSDEQRILKKILHYLHKRSKIRSRTRRKILQAIVETVFQTALMNQFVTPLPSVINLIRSLKNLNYQIILIGNVPGYAWDVFLRDYPQSKAILELFEEDHIFISGKLQMLKTSDTMYELIIRTHNLNPETCLVIESNCKNLQYPKQRNMQTLAFDAKKDDLRRFQEQLNQIV